VATSTLSGGGGGTGDNAFPPTATPRGERPVRGGSISKTACRVMLAMEGPLPVHDAEVALIETYLPDVIGVIIANDN
jgi:hypothetical protein